MQGSKDGLAVCTSCFTLFITRAKSWATVGSGGGVNSLVILKKKRSIRQEKIKEWFVKSRIKTTFKEDENDKNHHKTDKALRRTP